MGCVEEVDVVDEVWVVGLGPVVEDPGYQSLSIRAPHWLTFPANCFM